MERVIPIDLLKTFLVLYEHKSFSKTGEIVGRSQSAVSLQMRRLQEIAEGPLFTNSGKTLALTEQGRVLLDYAEQIIKLNDECMSRLHGRLIKGIVRIGIPSDFAITYLPRILGRFSQDNPNIELDVQCDLSSDLRQSIRDQNYDLVLCLHDGQPSEFLEGTWRDPAVWVGSRTHNLARLRPLPLVLFPEGCQYRNRIIQTLQNHDIAFRVVYSSSNMAGNQAAIQSGLGLTVLSRTTVPPYLKDLPQTPDLPDLGTVEIGLYWNKRGATKATQQLASYLSGILDRRLGSRPTGETAPDDEIGAG